jgi:hypothetical protein
VGRTLSERRPAHKETARLQPAKLDFARTRRACGACTVEQLFELRVAHDLKERMPDEVCAQQQHFPECGVHECDFSIAVEQEHPFLHSIKDATHEIAFRPKLGHRAREAPGELIERRTELADVLFTVNPSTHGEITFVHAPRRISQRHHSVVEPANRQLADQHPDQESEATRNA